MNNSNNTLLAKCTYLANCFASKAGRFIIQEPGKQIRTVHNLSELNFNKHFTGEERNGISPDVGEDCNFAVVDIDRMDTEQIKQFEFAQNIKKELLSEYNLQALIEQSKSKGYHVWIPFDGKIKRRFIQKLLTKVIRKFTDKKIANGIIEIFPKGNGGTSIFFPCFNSITPDGNSFSENFLTTKSTAILKDNGDVDTNFIANFARATICNTKTLQMLAWLDKYPPCFTKAYLNWARGVRNGYTLAIAGICEKLGLPLEEAIEAIRTIAEDCNDEELQARINIVKATYKKENPAGCNILQGKCEGIPVNAICSGNCSFVKVASEIEKTPAADPNFDVNSILMSYEDLQNEKPVDYLAGNLFPRCYVSVFFSEAGLGKTWLLFALAIDFSNGNSIFGKYPSIKMKVLIFQGDSPNNLTAERFNLLKNKPDSNYIKFINRYQADRLGYHINISDTNGQANFERCIEEFCPDLVIIDTFISFFDGDENRAKDVKCSTDFLRKLAEKHNCHIILTSHTRKRQSGEKRTNLDQSDLIGSSALSRLAGSIYSLIKNSEDEEKTSAIVRNIKTWVKTTQSFKFELITNTDDSLSILYERDNIKFLPKNKQQEIESHILEAIEIHPDVEFRKEELANDFGASVNTVGLVIKKLESKKILRQVGKTKNSYYVSNIEKNCKNMFKTTDITETDVNNGVDRNFDRKVIKAEQKFNPANNLTISDSSTNVTTDDVSNFFN